VIITTAKATNLIPWLKTLQEISIKIGLLLGAGLLAWGDIASGAG
jgi:hypothetical protein